MARDSTYRVRDAAGFSRRVCCAIGDPVVCSKATNALGEDGLDWQIVDVHAEADRSLWEAPGAVLVAGEDRYQVALPSTGPASGRRPDVRVVVVAVSRDEASMRKLIAAGADAVVLEEDIDLGLSATVRAVFAGQIAVPRSLRVLLDRPVLSSREKQVLGMVVLGFANFEIASRLVLAESTVKSHLHSAFKKLGVRSRNEAVTRILDPATDLGAGILSLSAPVRTRLEVPNRAVSRQRTVRP